MSKYRSEEDEGVANGTGNESGSGSPPTFEQAFGSLEEIVRQLESSQLGLSQALELYERGIRNLKVCHQVLGAAERRIEQLTSVNEAGEARTVPFDENEVPVEEKVGRRAPKKSSAKSAPPSDSSGGESETMDSGGTLF